MIVTMAQALLNGLVAGSLIAIVTIGFTTMYAILRYPNLAVAGYATAGAFAAWFVNARYGLNLTGALLAAFATSSVIGVLCETTLLRRLYPWGSLTVTIASIATGLLVENLIRFAFGNDFRSFDVRIEPDILVGPLFVNLQQLKNLLIAGSILLVLFAFFKLTSFGRAMRAVADNPDLARLKAIHPRVVGLAAVALGAGLTGLGGVLIGLDTSIDPLTGSRILLSIFAAAVLGGLGSIPGAVVGALALGIAQEVALIVIPPSYRSGVDFVAILLMLTFRPGGLMGERRA